MFKGSLINQKSVTYTPPNRINFLMFTFELDTWSGDSSSDFTLKRYLFGGVMVAKNADLDKYIYSGYDIGFDSEF